MFSSPRITFCFLCSCFRIVILLKKVFFSGILWYIPPFSVLWWSGVYLYSWMKGINWNHTSITMFNYKNGTWKVLLCAWTLAESSFWEFMNEVLPGWVSNCNSWPLLPLDPYEVLFELHMVCVLLSNKWTAAHSFILWGHRL